MRALLSLMLCLPGLALARPLDGVPGTGAKPEAFVPRGFAIELQVEGELSGDARPDRLLVLLEEPVGDEPRERALVWLHATEQGYTKVATNVGLLACFGCLGMNGGDGTPTITIERRVALVQQYGGAGVAYGTLHRLRFDAPAVRLIGLDSSEMERTSLVMRETSVNLLTGASETKVTDDAGKTKVTREKGKPAPVALEAVVTPGN